jgi:bifunctional UDP-N-acetylglucosamine pyrophosphorylase/glucosamine-1-phosphate N-acetyltransferase
LAARTSHRLALVVLAAGKGVRMRSSLPKVLHEVCGRPSLWHVLKAGLATKPTTAIVVVGHEKERVVEAVRSWDLGSEVVFVDQGTPRGTGHAVLAAEDDTAGCDEILVMNGDDPLVAPEQIREVLARHHRTRAAATVMTTFLDDPRGYGRVLREGVDLVGIVQEVDATPEQRSIHEISTLTCAFRRADLFEALPLVGRQNRQNEYYLPDVFAILREKGRRVVAVPIDLGGELGFNSRARLARVIAVMRDRLVAQHEAKGVTFTDPSSAYLDVEVRIGADTTILPGVSLEGATRIGAGATIGPFTRLVDTTVADEAEVTFAVARGAKIGRGASVGPFASLRPETVLDEGAKAGTFVEIKASRVGKGSKVPHLAYVGDATIGRDSNLGAGTVTVNYDGFAKHRTTVGDEVHVGSDTMLVAPVKLGRRAWTGAGSVITKDVPAGALAVERTDQRNVRGYDDRKRAKERAKQRTEARGTGQTTRGGRRG